VKVEPAEGVCSLAPELGDAMAAVGIADDDPTREAVYRFRYSVYMEELKRSVGLFDDRQKLLREPEDDEPGATLLYTAAGEGGVTGTARIRSWEPGAVPTEVAERFAMERFGGLSRLGTAEVGRVMLRHDRRGSSDLVALVCALYQLAAGELRSDVVFLTCLSGLVRHYRRIGFRTYRGHLVPTSDGVTVPMILVLSDRSYLEGAGSFLAPLVDAFFGPGKRDPVDSGRWAELFDVGHAPVELDSAAVWERVRRLRGLTDPQRTFLDALDSRTVHKLADQGFLMTVESGQLLTKEGLVQRELFVVLEGTFEVHDGNRRLRLVGPGEVIGEVGFFGTARRRSASVTAMTPGQILVIRRRWLNELRDSDPGCAADILFELARALADRVYAPAP
jgi:predicted GNAT family N-acyltransferase